MRRLNPKHIEEKSNRQKQLIVGIVLIGVMVFGTLGFAFNFTSGEEKQKKINYRGYDFFAQDGYWLTNVNGVEYVFRNNPNDLEEIGGFVNPVSNYYGKPLYFVSEQNEALYNIYENLEGIALRTGFACIEEDCEGDFPTKTCEDNLIIIKEGDSNEITQEGGCVFIVAEPGNLGYVAEIFLLKTIGIR